MKNSLVFFRSIAREFIQINWLKKREALYFTIAVVVIAGVLSLFFCGIDYVFFKLMKILLGLSTGE